MTGDIPETSEVRAARVAALFESFAPWPESLNLRTLARQPAQKPQFIVRDWLPAGYATLLAGHGGVGKSGVGLDLAVAIATGGDFCGLTCERRRVLYLSCEDREKELHWRLACICAQRGVDMTELAGSLDILDLVGHDAILWQQDARTGDTMTGAFLELAKRAERDLIQVLAVDGISDTFGGNETHVPTSSDTSMRCSR